MPSMIDQIRASKLPSSMMQFAARGALQVSPAENIEILVHLALHNKVFGDLARMTLAGWDEKACLAVCADPQTPREVLDYFSASDNLRPKLLQALLQNPSVPESQITKLAVSALHETIQAMLKTERVRSMPGVLAALKANPYLKKEDADEINKLSQPAAPPEPAPSSASGGAEQPVAAGMVATDPTADAEEPAEAAQPADTDSDEHTSAYLKEHAHEIASEGEKKFQAIGGIVEILGPDYFPVTKEGDVPEPAPSAAPAAGAAKAAIASTHAAGARKKPAPTEGKRENALQKINSLDVKGRIQLALKGNKEERSLLIRDGTKVVALAVLEAPKLSDGEVEKFASQKNVLEAVLRQIPLKRRFMKNYIVVRNLVANPRTPLDLGLGLMKNLLAQDLKNISANKEVSETIRKLALKMYKQKMEAANKK